MKRGAVGLLAALGCLSAGCGLPLPVGVQAPGAVSAQPALPQPIGVLPPDPLPGADPGNVVESFLTAQSSALDHHRVARGFLAAESRAGWDDAAGVTVYDPASLTPTFTVQGGSAVVTVGLDLIGGVATDGAAYVQQPAHTVQTYRLRKDGTGQWRIVGLPAGLTLTPGERDRSYTASDVYFLAPAVAGSAGHHLVADRLLLPAAADRAPLVVARLLAGPSTALSNSARTAFPTGTHLLSPVVTTSTGEVTVNLSQEAAASDTTQRQDLSAQLVWSLQPVVATFSRLRLLVRGRPLPVPGQAASARQPWPGYDPNGPRPDPPAFALVKGQVAALDRHSEDPRSDPLPDVRGVVDAAVDLRGQSVAVLTEAGGTRQLRLGPLTGQSSQGGQSAQNGLVAGPSDPGLRSPSWGSGERGLWLLRTGNDPALLLVAADGSSTAVHVENLPALGPDPVLRVSRDGVRIALVADGTLYVGRIEPVVIGQTVRVVDLQQRATDVLDVAWQTGTALEVLVKDDTAPRLPLERLSIDGTSVVPAGLLGVAQGDPVGVAASGNQPLLVQTTFDGGTLYRGDGGRGFDDLPVTSARRPFYPG